MIYPKISIVTPSFNQGQYLEQTILSVIGQNYPNLEYLIIDGGSTDNSIEVINKYAKNINFWVSETDKGQSHAINKGFERATGEIFAWLNSDDIYFPGILDSIYKIFQADNIGIYFGECIHFKEDNETLTSWGSSVAKFDRTLDLSTCDYIIQPSTFWTKKTWNEVGSLREDLHYTFDWDWYLRAKKLGVLFIPLKIPIACYRIHSIQKTSQGGLIRQREIQEIYNSYNSKIGVLYNKICQEKLKKDTFFFKVFSFISRIFRRNYSVGSYLKTFKFMKYSGYSVFEINQALLMK